MVFKNAKNATKLRVKNSFENLKETHFYRLFLQHFRCKKKRNKLGHYFTSRRN